MTVERLEFTHFECHVGASFRVAREDVPDGLALELTVARALDPHPGTPRNPPFVLEFRGPMEPMLGQGILPLEHPDLGVLDIFVVPVGPDGQGLCYEAIFN